MDNFFWHCLGVGIAAFLFFAGIGLCIWFAGLVNKDNDTNDVIRDDFYPFVSYTKKTTKRKKQAREKINGKDSD